MVGVCKISVALLKAFSEKICLYFWILFNFFVILCEMEVDMRNIHIVVLILVCFFLGSCQTRKDGAIEGAIVPPGTSARISAIQNGKTVLAVPAGEQDGKFKLALAPGNYIIDVAAPSSPYPLRLNDITVKPGETTLLPTIELAVPTGKSTLTGKILPRRVTGEVKLIYEGKERAAVHTDSEGKYEFKELPAGTYTVKALAPGHAEDATQVVIAENQNASQNAVLFPIITIDGVDWAAGKIRATGVGLPPKNAVNETVRQALAQRAALADAQRNMLRTIEQIRLDTDKNIKTAMSDKSFAQKIEGFLKGYTVVSEREREDGKFEVVLELPLTGPAGLSRYITE